MAELNPQKQLAALFAAASKLMEARAAESAAHVQAIDALADLRRLNGGSDRIELADPSGFRFFECEGDPETVLKFADDPPEVAQGSPAWKCPNVIVYQGWMLSYGAKRPKDAPMCERCAAAHKLRDSGKKVEAIEAPPPAPAPASDPDDQPF